MLLQSATAFFITKCDGLLLQSATAFLLQSVTSVITKCDRYYKVWQFYYKVRQVLQSATSVITKCNSSFYYKVRQLFYYKVRQVLLQSATGITKCDNFIAKCDRYYKVRLLLQSATVQTLVHETWMHGVSGSKVCRGLRGITLRFLHKINIKTEAEEEKPRIQRPQEKEELPSACPR